MENTNETRFLNGIKNVIGTNIKSTRTLEVGGLLVCKKTTAKCNSLDEITIKSTLVELDTLAGGGSDSLKYIYMDQSLGDKTPDGTIVRITGKVGVTEILCLSTGNMDMNNQGAIQIKPSNFVNFMWVESRGKWVWCSGSECSIA